MGRLPRRRQGLASAEDFSSAAVGVACGHEQEGHASSQGFAKSRLTHLLKISPLLMTQETQHLECSGQGRGGRRGRGRHHQEPERRSCHGPRDLAPWLPPASHGCGGPE